MVKVEKCALSTFKKNIFARFNLLDADIQWCCR